MHLDDILQTKQQEVDAAKDRIPYDELKNRTANHLTERNFRKALKQEGRLSMIAELKRKSPSKGMLRERFDPVQLGQSMEKAGAKALSVLTDEQYFGGSLDFLKDVKAFTEVPILRKDFIVDPYQVHEAAIAGADAVLLIVRILSDDVLAECMQAVDRLGMEALVEVHSVEDLRGAFAVGAGIIGINHRDLRTFEMQPKLSEELVPMIPATKTIVAESGLSTPEDLKRMKALGVHAVLIGEALMVAPDPGAKVKELLSAA